MQKKWLGEMITHKEAIKEAMKDPQFEILYKKNHFWVELSKFFYNERKNRNLSQKEFAKMHEIKKKDVKKIEYGDFNTLTLLELSFMLEKLGYYLELNFKEFKENIESEED